jgi:hypothetical protein
MVRPERFGDSCDSPAGGYPDIYDGHLDPAISLKREQIRPAHREPPEGMGEDRS